MSARASERTHVLGASRSHSVGAFVSLVEGEISSAEASPDGYVCEPSRAIRCGGLIHEGLRDPATIALGRSGGSGAICGRGHTCGFSVQKVQFWEGMNGMNQ